MSKYFRPEVNDNRETIEKIKEIKNQEFVLWKRQRNWPTFSYPEEKRNMIQITKIWNERENINIDFTDIKMIIKEYCLPTNWII